MGNKFKRLAPTIVGIVLAIIVLAFVIVYISQWKLPSWLKSSPKQSASEEPTATPKPSALPTKKPTTKPTATPTPETTSQDAKGPSPSPSYERHETIPILMYFSVSDEEENAAYLSPQHFSEHLECFAERGITTISMRELYDHWENDCPLPAKPLVLTFNDGFHSAYTNALPALTAKGCKATFYLTVEALDEPGYLTTDMVREMLQAGMEIGSRGMANTTLENLSQKLLIYHIKDSKKELEQLFGCPVTTFCYPGGRFSDATVAEVGRAGYSTAVLTFRPEAATPDQGLHTLGRIRIERGCGRKEISKILTGLGY
ncbi:MAG: polysaccharide deacetylase family protein [Clostridiaceae bacterium]|nr:polysaccharide deacetylase family protein [Clostridiaceae bacterium]